MFIVYRRDNGGYYNDNLKIDFKGYFLLKLLIYDEIVGK